MKGQCRLVRCEAVGAEGAGVVDFGACRWRVGNSRFSQPAGCAGARCLARSSCRRDPRRGSSGHCRRHWIQVGASPEPSPHKVEAKRVKREAATYAAREASTLVHDASGIASRAIVPDRLGLPDAVLGMSSAHTCLGSGSVGPARCLSWACGARQRTPRLNPLVSLAATLRKSLLSSSTSSS